MATSNIYIVPRDGERLQERTRQRHKRCNSQMKAFFCKSLPNTKRYNSQMKAQTYETFLFVCFAKVFFSKVFFVFCKKRKKKRNEYEQKSLVRRGEVSVRQREKREREREIVS